MELFSLPNDILLPLNTKMNNRQFMECTYSKRLTVPPQRSDLQSLGPWEYQNVGGPRISNCKDPVVIKLWKPQGNQNVGDTDYQNMVALINNNKFRL
jgi:hypothetical protein